MANSYNRSGISQKVPNQNVAELVKTLPEFVQNVPENFMNSKATDVYIHTLMDIDVNNYKRAQFNYA